eukprot:4391957-Prorocentrum_lima.AAC.1
MSPYPSRPGSNRNVLGNTDNHVPRLWENADGDSHRGELSIGGRMPDQSTPTTHLRGPNDKHALGSARKTILEERNHSTQSSSS